MPEKNALELLGKHLGLFDAKQEPDNVIRVVFGEDWRCNKIPLDFGCEGWYHAKIMRRKKVQKSMNKKIWILTAAVLLALSLCACGGTASNTTSSEEQGPTAAETAPAATQDPTTNVAENPDLDSYACATVTDLEKASGIPMPIDGDVTIVSCYNMEKEKPAVAIVNFTSDGFRFCYAGSQDLKVDQFKEKSSKTTKVDETEVYISPIEDDTYGFRAAWEGEDGTVYYLYYAGDLSNSQLETVLGGLI